MPAPSVLAARAWRRGWRRRRRGRWRRGGRRRAAGWTRRHGRRRGRLRWRGRRR